MRTTRNQDFTEIRLAELMAALSVASDLAMGQPLDYALCSCVLAMRIGAELGLDTDEQHDVYYQALLRYIGCNAETDRMAAIAGDELALRTDVAGLDTADTGRMLGVLLRHIRGAHAHASPLARARALIDGVIRAPGAFEEIFHGHCEVARRLAERLEFNASLVRGLGQLYARWDGRGVPAIQGEDIAIAVRVVTLAQDAVILARLGGIDAAVTAARTRRGRVYDPRIADLFCRRATTLMSDLDDEPSWEAALALEPGPPRRLTGDALDNALRVLADYADIKSPFALNHSSRVAELAVNAAKAHALPAADAHELWRAGMLHDVGRVGVSAGIWGKPGALTEREWEKVRLHSYYTERILARPDTLARLGRLAASGHERLDGGGYHRRAGASMLAPGARILAAADAYCAMGEPRPHREPLTAEAAARALRDDVRAGRLDGDAVQSVLAAAGHRLPASKRDRVAGLTEREVEVLRLLARGHPTKRIARLLDISVKTADNHIQHIYGTIGVTTRAGATLYAMEKHLLSP